MFKKQSLKIIVSFSLIILIVLSGIQTISAEDYTSEDFSNSKKISDGLFINYIQKYSESDYPDEEIKIFDFPNLQNILDDNNSFNGKIVVNTSGLYALNVSYKVLKTIENSLSFSIKINDKIPFFEASSIKLFGLYSDLYTDKNTKHLKSTDIPNKKIVDEFVDMYCFDTIGYYGGMLYFYLEKGENSVSINVSSGSVNFKKASFKKYNQPLEYETDNVKNAEYKGENVIIEAENILNKSDFSCLSVNDSSSASISPSSPYEKYINTFGGSNWKNVGQCVSWKIKVPKDSKYQLTVKYKQDINIGMTSYRRILIDGKVPYKELEEYPFSYSNNFTNEILSKNGEPIMFDLSSGEHIITMQTVVGKLSSLLPLVNSIITELTEDYRQVIMVTGTSPDVIRDYFLENSIPNTVKSLKDIEKRLTEINESLEKIMGGSSTGSKTIGIILKQLKEFNKDSYNITKNLPSFKSNISALCSWLLEAKTQPLKIDYFVLSKYDKDLSTVKNNFFDNLSYTIKSFLFTFSSEYEGNSINSTSPDTITVWMTGSSAKYNVLNRLIQGDFEKNSGIKVDLKLVSSNLATSIIAGKNPDIALERNPTEIMNLVYRNVVPGLNNQEGYSEFIKNFRDSALTPLSYQNILYAVPDTQTFQLMFYRKDVFNELNLEPPDTWDDVIYCLSELKKNNLEFGIPHNMEGLVSLIYQNGGKLYNETATATELNNRASIDAFSKFTSFFTDYSCPLAFNAQNRFRTGEMPIVIADINFYNILKVLAPEIAGLWEVLPYPTTKSPVGTLAKGQMSTVTGDVVLNEKNLNSCFEFLKWKSSSDIQIRLSSDYELILGQSERLMSANKNAFKQIGWGKEILNIIDDTENNLYSIPTVPGSYYVTRHINNAIADVIYKGNVAGDSLIKYSKLMDDEINYKIGWYGLNKNKGE